MCLPFEFFFKSIFFPILAGNENNPMSSINENDVRLPPFVREVLEDMRDAQTVESKFEVLPFKYFLAII